MINENGSKLAEINARGSKSVAKFHFIKKAIDRLVPGPTRAYYHDDVVRGLTIAVNPTGTKTFVLYRKINGRPERVKIGAYPDLSIDQARNMAMQMNGVIAQGGNPANERRSVRAEMTLQELFDSYLLLFAKERKRTWKQDEWTFNKYLHGWRLRKLSDIRRQDVIQLHSHIGRTKGKYMANRVVELLSAIFNRARRDWGLECANPAAEIEPFKERRRERFLDGNELPRFFAALEQEPNELMRDYFSTALFTGARRSNVAAMEFPEIDWNRAEWIIPPEKSKEDEPIRIALVPPALEILMRRKLISTSQWVFPSTGKTGHLVEPKRAWGRILERAKLTDVRLHDLRRTLGSWQTALGANTAIVGKSLGHAPGSAATAIYSQLNLDPVRQSVTAAVDAMLATKMLNSGNGK